MISSNSSTLTQISFVDHQHRDKPQQMIGKGTWTKPDSGWAKFNVAANFLEEEKKRCMGRCFQK
jgi:hypothetical protein